MVLLTGKTVIATQISKFLNCKTMVKVRGPELLACYLGDTEKAIRDLFKNAINDSDKSNLHLIFIDEIDGLFGKPTDDSKGYAEQRINQLLAMTGDKETIQNVIIIGTTNKIDTIDSRVCRSGRLDILIEINLPDIDGREEILKIYLEPLYKTNCLDTSVNINLIAKETSNYSGADLQKLVNDVKVYCINNYLKLNEITALDKLQQILETAMSIESINITMDDFRAVIQQNKINKVHHIC